MSARDLTPRYYLRHRLPDGTDRYAYPVALIEGTHERAYPGDGRSVTNGHTWTARGQHGAEVDHVWSGRWLVTREVLAALTRTRPGPTVQPEGPDGWRKRGAPSDPEAMDDEAPLPAAVLMAHPDLPEVPAADEVAHYARHDAAHACVQCRSFVMHYAAHRVEGATIVATQNLDDWSELVADLPPVIDLGAWSHPPSGATKTSGLSTSNRPEAAEPTWSVDDTSRTAIYGAHTAHLWPGRLSGLRSAVAAVLTADPRVSSFYDWHDNRSQGYHGFDVTISVPWDPPAEKDERYKPRGARKHRVRQVPVYAASVKVNLDVPAAVSAASLAEAVAGWDDAVADQVRRFLPFGNVAACSACQGLGHVQAGAARSANDGEPEF